MELDEIQEVAHYVGDVCQLVGATVVFAPSVNTIVLHLLVRLQAVARQYEANHVLR